MYLSEAEQRDLVYEAEVSTEGHGGRRWSESMTTVVRADDGKFYRINWERGLTENQDDDFESGDVPEVFSIDSVSVERERLYLTAAEQLVQRPTLAQRVLAEQESYAIVTGKELSAPVTDEIHELALKLRSALPGLDSMDLAGQLGVHRAATEQYLDAIIALKEGSHR